MATVNIASFLARAALANADRPALIFPNPARAASSLTFRELDELSSRMAAGLFDLGLRAGDRAIVLAPISPYLFAGLIALFKIGAAAVFLDPQAGIEQLDRVAELAEAKAFVGSRWAAWLRWISPNLRRTPLHLRVAGDGPRSLQGLALRARSLMGIADVEPETPALITFTGGSTDTAGPRGVARTHRLLTAQHAAIARAFPWQPGDVDLPAFPIASLHNLASGVTSVIPDFPFRRPDAVRPDRILRQIETFGVTTASGSPAYWWRIAEYCLARGRTLPLRRIITGGAPVAPRLTRLLSRAAPRAEIFSAYGSTEAEPVAVMAAQDVLAETAALTAQGAGIPLGHPVPGLCARVLDGQENPRGDGEAGEIWVAGDHVARAYFAAPRADAANKRADPEGRVWHRMGDVGYEDSRGQLWLLGRVNTVITRMGHALYPVRVEAAVETLPFIRRAALVGVPDKRLGERAVLVVEFERRAWKPTDWRPRLRALCADHGWPLDGIRAVPRVPVDARHNARIDYVRLRRALSGAN